MIGITAMEGVHGQPSNRAERLHRGRTTLLASLMQGWGQLVNQVVLILALLGFYSGGSPPYGEVATQYTFRVSFALIAIFLLSLIYIGCSSSRTRTSHSMHPGNVGELPVTMLRH